MATIDATEHLLSAVFWANWRMAAVAHQAISRRSQRISTGLGGRVLKSAPLTVACAVLLAYVTGLRAQVTTPPSSNPSDAPVATPDTSVSEYQQNARLVQLVPGATIVTAYANPEGDAESIKQIVSHDASGLRFHYSTKQPNGQNMSLYQLVPDIDLRTAMYYKYGFLDGLPELLPGTTALGVSTGLLRELKSGQKVDADLQTANGCCSRHGYYQAIGDQDVLVRVVVNDREVDLPAVHARAESCPEGSTCMAFTRGEFWFLDNLDAPIALKYVVKEADRQVELNVVKIIVPVEQKQLITTALANEHRAILEGVYFDFDKASIRPESGVVLSSLAEVLRENPSWKLRVEGNTDNVGTEAYNMKLSMSRAAAVRQALIAQYRVSAMRLTAAGNGASQPKATNETLEGRAFNRRVELVRTDQTR